MRLVLLLSVLSAAGCAGTQQASSFARVDADLDVAFQKDVLKRLEPLAAAGDTDPKNFAFLYDRVATNEERPQRYGTQGECLGPGSWKPNPLQEPARVDELRAAIGLEPLSEYTASNSKGCF